MLHPCMELRGNRPQFLTNQCLSYNKPNLLYDPPLMYLKSSRIYAANIKLIHKANTIEGFLTANSYSKRTLFILRTPVSHFDFNKFFEEAFTLQTVTVVDILP
jgi:hypothetical protein